MGRFCIDLYCIPLRPGWIINKNATANDAAAIVPISAVS
jgi:hypothetical protein